MAVLAVHRLWRWFGVWGRKPGGRSHRYPLWIANYGVDQPLVPKPWGTNEWQFWQFTASGDGLGYGAESLGVDLIAILCGLRTTGLISLWSRSPGGPTNGSSGSSPPLEMVWGMAPKAWRSISSLSFVDCELRG